MEKVNKLMKRNSLYWKTLKKKKSIDNWFCEIFFFFQQNLKQELKKNRILKDTQTTFNYLGYDLKCLCV